VLPSPLPFALCPRGGFGREDSKETKTTIHKNDVSALNVKVEKAAWKKYKAVEKTARKKYRATQKTAFEKYLRDRKPAWS